MNQTILKIARIVGVIAAVLCLTVVPAFAGTDNEIARKGAEWLLDGLFWAGVLAAVIILIKQLTQKNFIGMLITVLIAGVVLVLIKSPTILQGLGQRIVDLLGLG